jgi:hypothetical protein
MRRTLRTVNVLAVALVACGGTDASFVDGGADGAEGRRDDDTGAQVDVTSADAARLMPETAADASDASPPMASCDELSCPDGCCTADGVCSSPPTDRACGFGGEACIACAAGDSCSSGACLHPQPDCGPSNCPGCCQGNTQCASGAQDVACGRNGQQCQRCVPREGSGACVPEPIAGGECGGSGTCHYPGCAGCCLAGSCSDGVNQARCGSNGENCRACAGGQQCVPAPTSGGTCAEAGACGPQNCPGCCHGDVCAYGDQDLACGAGGSVCVDCAMYLWKCDGGACH